MTQGVPITWISQHDAFQFMSFAIIVMIMNRQTCELFKNILNDVQTEGNGGDNYGIT